jgi:hypothetical protein
MWISGQRSDPDHQPGDPSHLAAGIRIQDAASDPGYQDPDALIVIPG